MKRRLRDRIAALATMSAPALCEEHRRVFDKEPVSTHRHYQCCKMPRRLEADEPRDPARSNGTSIRRA